jgi:hypothetical protein
MKKLGIGVIFGILVPLFSLTAQSVDILWQGESYTPPFYEGLPMWSRQSLITLVAIPNGLGSPSALSYKWSKNGTVLGSLSGIGKNSLKFADTVFSKPQRIEVEIISSNEETLAESSIIVTPRDFTPLVYEKNPLYGYLFHHEVGESFRLYEGEVTFSAFPLFSSPPLRDGANLSYKWSTNSGESGVGQDITYRVPEEGGGSAMVNLRVTNSEKILPSISRSFLVQFGEE